MNLLKTIIERLNQRVEVANIFDKQFGLCELNANGNEKAWVHYIGNGQAEVVTNFDAKQGTLFWAKRGKVTVVKTDAFKVSGCKQLYVTSFPLTAYAVVRKSHLPCDSEDAQDWLASRIYKITSGTDPVFKQAIGVINYEVVPSGYINEIKTLTANYEWACVSVDFDIQVITTTEDGCYDICQTGDIPLPDLPACTPCLTEVAVDGVTIIGNGTAEDPLSAIGAGGGAIVVQDEGVEVTPVATTLNFTGAGVTASLTSPGVVEVNVPGGGVGVGTLQDVTDLGNSTTNDIDFIANAGLSFDNGAFFRKGTTDAGNGGAKGTAQICSISYELKWEAGRLYYMEQDGFTIRDVTHNFSIVPQVTDDSTKGFVVGSRWSLDDGTVYLCSDATIGAAVWAVVSISVPSLQNVTDVGNTTTNDIIVQGANDFVGQVSSQVITAYNSVTGAYVEMFVNTSGQLTLSDGTSAGILSVNNLTNSNVQLEFPNKVTGNYTIATTADIVNQVNSDWNAVSGLAEILNKPTIPTVTPSALTKTDDTNVTLTLGGSPTTSLLAATSLTLGWSGTLADARIASAATWNAKQNAITTGTTLQYFRGDLSLATFPTALPPSGAASGDLSGTYPSPTVDRIHGIDMQSGTPTADDVWIYGGAPAKWQHQKLHSNQVTNDSTVSGTNVDNALTTLDSGKQATLVSGTNIKTINSTSLLGSGNITTGTVTSVAALTLGTTGTDLTSTVATGTTTPVITLNVPTASAANRGALSAADWTTFNGKQAAITPAALTKVDDTNVTLTLGGTPTTALLQAASITAGWTGTLADARIASAATWNAKQAALVSGTNIKTINSTSILGSGNYATPFELVVAASDETTALTTGTAKITFRMPRAVTLTAVRASLTTAQASGTIFTVDINESGTSILSTKLTIDNTETTSTTAVTAPVISDTALADDAEMTIDIDQIGNGSAKGLKVMLIGNYA